MPSTPKVSPKRAQSAPKVCPKWAQIDAKVCPKWAQSAPKVVQNVPKTTKIVDVWKLTPVGQLHLPVQIVLFLQLVGLFGLILQRLLIKFDVMKRVEMLSCIFLVHLAPLKFSLVIPVVNHGLIELARDLFTGLFVGLFQLLFWGLTNVIVVLLLLPKEWRGYLQTMWTWIEEIFSKKDRTKRHQMHPVRVKLLIIGFLRNRTKSNQNHLTRVKFRFWQFLTSLPSWCPIWFMIAPLENTTITLDLPQSTAKIMVVRSLHQILGSQGSIFECSWKMLFWGEIW